MQGQTSSGASICGSDRCGSPGTWTTSSRQTWVGPWSPPPDTNTSTAFEEGFPGHTVSSGLPVGGATFPVFIFQRGRLSSSVLFLTPLNIPCILYASCHQVQRRYPERDLRLRKEALCVPSGEYRHNNGIERVVLGLKRQQCLSLHDWVPPAYMPPSPGVLDSSCHSIWGHGRVLHDRAPSAYMPPSSRVLDSGYHKYSGSCRAWELVSGSWSRQRDQRSECKLEPVGSLLTRRPLVLWCMLSEASVAVHTPALSEEGLSGGSFSGMSELCHGVSTEGIPSRRTPLMMGTSFISTHVPCG